MRLVILETPFKPVGNTETERTWDSVRKQDYARACMRDSLYRGEAPYASHLLYTQPFVLNDADVHERAMGIEAGLAWKRVAEATIVYTDLGISEGMQMGIDRAQEEGRSIEFRKLETWARHPTEIAYQQYMEACAWGV